MGAVEKDYIMRLIHEVIRTLIKLIFGKDINEGTELVFREEYKEWGEQLKELIDDGKIDEAENRLLDEMENGSAVDLEAALTFYAYLNEKDNEFLESHHFSRKEVMEGIRYACEHYGYGSMAQSLLEQDMD